MQKYNFSAVLFQNVNMAAFSAVCRADMLEFKAKKNVSTKKSVFF